MKFSELNKQQKEYLILGVMGVITTIAVLQNLVIAPTRAKAAAARETIGKLESDVRTGESILARDRTNRNRLQTVSGEILERMEREAPPDFSRYTWALGRISRIARQNDIFPQIREFGGQRYMPHRQNYPQIRDKSGMWIPYAIEVDFRTSYTQTMQFLRALHEEDPLASVGQLTIRANPDDPQNHLVNLIIEWPVFRHPEDKEFLTASKGATPLMRPLLCLAAFIFTLTAPAENQPLRDPFWPIGFTPGHDTPAAGGPEPVEPEAAPVVLSDDELRELAREEARNIQASLETQGIAIMGGRIYGFIQGRWVTVGDSFTTQVLGREYRLLITRLTATEIELEPFRIPTQ